MREFALQTDCGYCGAKAGQGCLGVNGGAYKPHWQRRQFAENATATVDAFVQSKGNPLDTQEGGDHYKTMAIQPVEFITRNELGFCVGNCIKYLCRFEKKNGKEDLLKARHYIDLLLHLRYPTDS